MKKRILMCTEASYLPTGYGVYTKELLSRLVQNDGFEIAELACYANALDGRIKNIPWHVYANKPLEGTPEMSVYENSPTAEFGEFTFNTVCLDFMPDFVVDIRDPWVFEFQTRSPFRKFFKHVLMPTVDAAPQNPDWIDMFSEADAILTYSEFGKSVIEEQSDSNNFVGIASPCASDNFYRMENKDENRAIHRLPTDIYIVGTVMRNQRRKLFPELFRDFSEYLKQTGRKDVYLYCHTSFPDVGWCIPELLMEYGLSTRVLFTYKCKNCDAVTSSFFKDSVSHCGRCGHFQNNLVGVGNGISEQELCKVYNLFDIYVQYANSEGFGMPQLEAAKCGNVVMSINYSAMSSIIDNIDAIPIPVAHLTKECETGCMRAIPCGKSFVRILKDLLNTSKSELSIMGEAIQKSSLKAYNWDKTAREWENYFTETPVYDINSTWFSKIEQGQPAAFDERYLLPSHRADYLIRDVLGKPELIGRKIWRRLIKDLTYGSRVENAGNTFYFNESHIKDNLRTIPFGFEAAYEFISDLRDYHNTWEGHRRTAYTERIKNYG